MTPTDELIAALRARAANIDGHIAEIQGSDGSPYDVFRKELRAAADRLASLAAPVGEWETTAEDRSWLSSFTAEMGHTDDGDTFRQATLIFRLLRDLDRALASLSAERDQNKRLVEALREADGCFEAALAEGWIDALAAGDIERIRDIWRRRIALARSLFPAALAQPEEQR